MGNNSKIVSAIDDEAMVGDHPARQARGRRYRGLIRLEGEVRGIMLHTNPTGKDELMAIGRRDGGRRW